MSDRRSREIPPAADELRAAGQRKIGEGRLKFRELRPVGEDEAATERAVMTIAQSYGANAQIPPTRTLPQTPISSRSAVETPELPPPSFKSKFASFRIDLPEYLDQELTMRAARDRVTKAYLVLDALRLAGFTVQNEDLVTDRRKTRWKP